MIKANIRYRITGEPNVRKEEYIKKIRMLAVGIPNLFASFVHTPNA